MSEPGSAPFFSPMTALPGCCIAPAALGLGGMATAGAVALVSAPLVVALCFYRSGSWLG